jgi:hypothetical protein
MLATIKTFLWWNGGMVAQDSGCHYFTVPPPVLSKKIVAQWHEPFSHDKTYHLMKDSHEKLDFLVPHFDGNRFFLLSESIIIISFPLLSKQHRI